MDFDITSSEPSVTEDESADASSAPVSDDLMFDVTGGHTPIEPEEAQPESSTTETDDAGMAFTLDFPVEETAEEKATPAAQSAGIGLEGINLNFDDVPATGDSSEESKDEHWQDVATKLDLAKAYHEMGDASGAREIIEEVLREGDTEQRETAQALLDQLG
jgi:pilus assembly protein FimV